MLAWHILKLQCAKDGLLLGLAVHFDSIHIGASTYYYYWLIPTEILSRTILQMWRSVVLQFHF